MITAQVGNNDTPLEDAPFVQALKCASTFLVVRNRNMDLYDRAWCICELIVANDRGLCPDRTRVTGPSCFADHQSSCLAAKCSSKSDHVKILSHLIGNDNNVKRIERVDEQIAAFRQFAASAATLASTSSAASPSTGGDATDTLAHESDSCSCS